jgi:regulator of protease activity HflC (stomatin/prohibitin superfamily)
MQDVSGYITVDSILNNMPGFEAAVRKNISDRFAADGFIVDNFSILKQPTPTDVNLATAINAKIKAKQDAETSKMQLQSSIAEANKQVAKARGDSATKVINAMGEAEAVRKIQQVLTPTYVQYILATRWNGVQPTVVGGGSGMILQLKQ